MKTKGMALIALLSAIEIVLFLTPLGFILVGPIRITTLHIPVIFGSLFLGWKYGLFLGFLFSVLSFTSNLIAPTIFSFIFNPFVEVGLFKGNIFSLVIVLVPRLIFPLVAYWCYYKLKLPLFISVLVSTLSHSLLVMGMIFIFFAQPYMTITNSSFSVFATIILTTIFINGTLEAIAGMLLIVPLFKRLRKE